jgi:hypothetical protein
MWSTLDRTRRRLIGLVLRPALEFSAPVADPTELDRAAAAPGPTTEVVIAIGRPEFDRLGAALQAALGRGTTRPDTPDRLEAALAQAIAGLGVSGLTRVSRRPAGLYTPEGWQVSLTEAEPAVERAIRRAIREGVFAA